MPINFFINRTLYFVLTGFLLFIIFYRPKGIIFARYHFLLSVVILFFLAGFSLAYFRSTYHSTSNVSTDIFRSISLPIGLAVGGWKLRYKPKIESYIIWGMLLFEIASFIANYMKIPVIGNVIKWSTVQQSNTAICGFYALFLISRRRSLLPARLTIATAWVSAIVSLSKWQYFPGLSFPILWGLFEAGLFVNAKKERTIVPLLMAVAAIITIVAMRDTIVTHTVMMKPGKPRYVSFENYWYSRVAKKDPSSQRFEIWSEMIGRLNERPLLGLGFGVRSHSLVAEHNIFVFVFTRFGYPIGILYLLAIIRLLSEPLFSQAIYLYSKITLTTLSLYFMFTASVGEIYAQLLNCLTLGIVINQILNFEFSMYRSRQSAITTGYKGNDLARRRRNLIT